MDYWLLGNLLAIGLSVLMSGTILSQILAIAFRRRLFDTQDERKIHKGVVPRLGGCAFAPSMAFSVIFVIGVGLKLDNFVVLGALSQSVEPIFFLVFSLMLLYLVGINDDLIGVRYLYKFMFQIVCAIFTVASGAYISDFNGFLGLYLLPDWFGALTTGFLVVYIVNALNLIDGIDGLCSGLAGLALTVYALILFTAGEYVYSLLACATLGTLIPFFYFNVFGSQEKHKKIFMGDTGSLTIGMVVVFLAIEITRLDNTGNVMADVNPILLAFAPLILPMFDVMRVFYRRVRLHRSPFLPDRSHIHHKFLALGLSQRAALGCILTTSVVFLVANIVLSPYIDVNVIILGDIVVWILANVMLTKAIRVREENIGQVLYQ